MVRGWTRYKIHIIGVISCVLPLFKQYQTKIEYVKGLWEEIFMPFLLNWMLGIRRYACYVDIKFTKQNLAHDIVTTIDLETIYDYCRVMKHDV